MRPMASIVSLADGQLDALPAKRVHAGPGEGLEESTATPAHPGGVDVAGSLARARRHSAALARLGGVVVPPSYDDRPAYSRYVVQAVDALRLAHVSGAEVVAVHSRVTATGVDNRLPPPWGLARLLVRLVYDQAVRDEIGAGLRFTSLHRTAPYNLAIGGERNSQHVVCLAADRAPLGGVTAADLHRAERAMRGRRIALSPARWAVVERVMQDYRLRPATLLTGPVLGEPFSRAGLGFTAAASGRPGGFNALGGLGKYEQSGFVHADLRGIRAQWNG